MNMIDRCESEGTRRFREEGKAQRVKRGSERSRGGEWLILDRFDSCGTYQ